MNQSTFRRVQEIVLWLFVINLGVCFGAGLYEARIEVPNWLLSTKDGYVWNGAAARIADSGMRFWAFVSTMPLTLLMIFSLRMAARSRGELRRWWFIASLVTLAERIFTFSYFIPTMIQLLHSDSTPEAATRALMWERLNYLRHVLALGAWLAALKTFAVFYRQQRD